MVLSSSWAQSALKNSTAKDSSLIQWSAGNSHDFAHIKQGTPVTFTFKFINNGKEPIAITRGDVPCSCMSIAYTQDTIASSGHGEVRIGYNAHTAGRFSKNATVVFSNHEHTVLKISGEVVQ
jgi:hypothetical protein